jgi:signal transduction histidine kinase
MLPAFEPVQLPDASENHDAAMARFAQVLVRAHMDRRKPSGAALYAAALVVIASLAALVALPLVTAALVARERTVLVEHADPARSILNEISYLMSHQIAALTRATATGERQFVDEYRKVAAPQRAAKERLGVHIRELGPSVGSRYARLQERIDDWHRSVERSVDSESLAFDTNYPLAIAGIRDLDEAINTFQVERQRQIQRLTTIQDYVSIVLVVLAALAAGTVLWMTRRLHALATGLAEESGARMKALERETQLVRLRDQILGVVAHDLRSPLTTITLSSQLIEGSSEEEQKEHLATIRASSRRMERLIQDLLDVTKIERSALSIQHEPVDLAEVAREVIRAQKPIARSKEIEFRPAIAESLPSLPGDAHRLAQVLTNLISNAFKFTPAGGTVDVTIEEEAEAIRIEVADSGSGIDPGDLPHLFEPFWQAKKTAHLGAGLGLRISRGIVEAHGGTIEAGTSSLGGASFTIHLPRPTRTL